MEDVSRGTDRFDQVMLSVASGEVGPIAAGVVYCAVILECMQIFDLARAAEWTNSLTDWCEAEPELVPYRGQCLVHRSQLQQAEGDWPKATTSAKEACLRLTDPPHPALGLAHYQAAELNRLVGSFDDAVAAYGRAAASGQEPMPGLALLALSRGDSDTAAAAITRSLSETTLRMRRPSLLAAAVEIFRETRNLAAAREACDELALIAAGSPSEVLGAMTDQALGSVLLGEGEPALALTHLRRACTIWTKLRMPYEGARTSVLVGLGCLALGDHASADLELGNARSAFDALGAQPDADRARSLHTGVDSVERAGGDQRPDLSERELEVLTHVAAGETNRTIATALTISQHTVGRHLENIFAKLGVSGRAAATAYAYEHHLL